MSGNKTMQDLEKVAMHDPIVRSYLTLLAKGDLTLEETLINLAFTLMEVKSMYKEKLEEHLERCTSPSF